MELTVTLSRTMFYSISIDLETKDETKDVELSQNHFCRGFLMISEERNITKHINPMLFTAKFCF